MHSLPIESQYEEPQDFRHSTFFMESTQFYLWISSKLPTSYLDLLPTCQQQISSPYTSNICQSYPTTSTKLLTNSYIHDYRTRRCSVQCMVFSGEKLRVGPKLRGFYFRAEFLDAILMHEAFLQKRGLQSVKPWTWTQMKQELFGSDDIPSSEG